MPRLRRRPREASLVKRALRIAVAGLGLIGRRHAELIRASSDCVLHAVADPSPAAGALAAELGVPLSHSLDELLAMRPDGVVLATPNALHAAQALACIAHRVPVLVEKPVADTLADAQRLVQAVEASSVAVLVGHHRRHSAILEAARAVVASGRLGRLVAISGSATFRKPDAYFDEGPWRKQAGGGPILINMVHEVDNLRTMLCESAGEIVEVQAMASSATRGFEVEDTVSIGLRFAGGALGSFLLSDCAASPRSWEQTSGEDKRYERHADEDCYVIAGTRGSLGVPTMRLREYRGEASWWAPLHGERLQPAERDPLAAQLDHFAAVVRGEAQPRVTVRDATRTLAVTLAIAQAARQAAPVRLEL
jgi:predicted dehydrogenase